MARFITKPFSIEAVQFTGDNVSEIDEFISPLEPTEVPEYFVVPTCKFTKIGEDPEGFTAAVYDDLHDTWVKVKPGQWIIRGQKGEYYPCDPEIFEAKYEEVYVQDGS